MQIIRLKIGISNKAVITWVTTALLLQQRYVFSIVLFMDQSQPGFCPRFGFCEIALIGNGHK